jgi:hypothetical protein
VLDQFLRLLLLIEVMLQAPAFQSRAFVREHRDDVARFNAHLALGGVGDKRLRELHRRPRTNDRGGGLLRDAVACRCAGGRSGVGRGG